MTGPDYRADPAAEPDDATLLKAIAAGDTRQFDLFVNRYKGRLFGYLCRRTGDAHRAEDLTQEVFLRVFRAVGRSGFAGAASASTWLFTIANNCAVDEMRTRQRRPVVLQGDLGEGAASGFDRGDLSADPAAEAVRAADRRRASEALRRLPEEQQQVVSLKLVGGLTFSEIAEVVGCPMPTVKARMRYALQKLAAALADDRKECHG
jgi:RNA polymerase sigma-70 factor, ECF subfamily